MEKICVLMTCYNPQEYIINQIDSVLSQKNVEIKLVIRDDCSTQRKYIDLVKEYDNVTLIEGKENLGVKNNILELIKYANDNLKEYKYFAYSDQDDVWLEDKLITGVRILKGMDNNKPCLYYSNLRVCDKNLKEQFDLFKYGVVKNTFEQGLAQIFAFACTFVFNSVMLEQLVIQSWDYLGFDHVAYYLAIIRGEIFYDDKSYILYRQHGNNVSGVKKRGVSYFFSKIKLFFNKPIDNARAGGGSFKEVAKYILKYYSDELSEKELEKARKVAFYHSIVSRFKLIFDSEIKAGYFPKDIYRSLWILVGRY